MQALRRAIPAASRALRDTGIVDRLVALEEVAHARTIALFVPMEGRAEVDLRRLDERLRSEGRRVFYPRLSAEPSECEQGPSLTGELAESPLTALVPSGAGFLEPGRDVPAAVRGDVDVVIVPALAVSASGHRLGYGAGFYDKLLPSYCPPAASIVVAYDFQLVAELPVCDWDVACALVVTDSRLLRPTAR